MSTFDPSSFGTVPNTDLHLPRVTKILNIISKGEGFNNWLKKQGDKADTILETAGDFGSEIHHILQEIGQNKEIAIDILSPKHKRCTKAFIEWKDDHIKRFIETEQPVWDIENGYFGTLDAVVELKDGRLAVLDYKTSGRIYDTYYLQVSAYTYAYQLLSGEKIDTAFILRFEKDDTKMKNMEEKEVSDLAYEYEHFLTALKLWKWQNNKIKHYKEGK